VQADEQFVASCAQQGGISQRSVQPHIRRLAVLAWLLLIVVFGSSGIGAAASPGAVPAGYWVDVDESGTTTSAPMGGSGSLSATGTGNVNYGWGRECAGSADGGPFSSGHYPPLNCEQAGRAYSSAGSPESPAGFWFTGNQNCVKGGRAFSGSAFTWNVQLPETGYWHVEAYIPSWTSYGWGNQYVLKAGDGEAQNYPLTQQAYHGQWVSLFGRHQYLAGQSYNVTLTSADGSDAYCHYQTADQMRWVFEGPLASPSPEATPSPEGTGVNSGGATTQTTTPSCPAQATAAWRSPARRGRVVTRATAARRRRPVLTPKQAVARTISTRTRRFSISITLSRRLARLFDPGQECAEVLQGSGFVNFRKRAARWSIALPSVFQGSLKIIAIGNRTWVDAPQFTPRGAHNARWMELQSTRDYRSFDRLPLLRDLVVLTNPLRGLSSLAASRPSQRGARRARSAAFQATTADSPSISASCAQQSQSVANGDSPDAKRWTDQFSMNTQVEEDTYKSWGESKISAEADSSGVCEERISVETPSADGFDVVFDFKGSSQANSTVTAPQSTVTEEWKVVYHVKQPPCVEGTWSVEEGGPVPVYVGAYTVEASAVIGGNSLTWTRDYHSTFSFPSETSEPLPPYEPIPIVVTDITTSNFVGAIGAIVGTAVDGVGTYTGSVTGPQTDAIDSTIGGGGSEVNELDRPMRLEVNCASDTLRVEQFRTLTIGPPLVSILHRTSPIPPPRVTVEQNWRSEISAPLSGGS
jgi:hypothetical protein